MGDVGVCGIHGSMCSRIGVDLVDFPVEIQKTEEISVLIIH